MSLFQRHFYLNSTAVSYTHLDVYKRQVLQGLLLIKHLVIKHSVPEVLRKYKFKALLVLVVNL